MPASIQANHFLLTTSLETFYQYDVKIAYELKEEYKKEHAKKEKNKEMDGLKKIRSKNCEKNFLYLEEARKQGFFGNQYPAYDGENIFYTTERLEDDNFTLRLNSDSINISFKMVQECNLRDLYDVDEFENILNGLTIILRHCVANSPDIAQVYQGFYTSRNAISLKGKLELWTGYIFSLLLIEKELYFNLDLSNKVFYPHIPLLNFINANGGVKDLSPFTNIRIYTEHCGFQRYYTIKKFSHKTAKSEKFSRDNREWTVFQYFKEFYEITLKHPNLPLVDVSNSSKEILLPIEVCHIKKKQVFRKATGTEIKDEIKRQSIMPPYKRFNLIKENLAKYIELSQPILNKYKIRISKDPQGIPLHYINPPKLVTRGSQIKPYNGEWKIKQLHQVVSLRKWIVIHFSNDIRMIRTFVEKLRQNCLGMDIDMPIFFKGDPNLPKNSLKHCVRKYPGLQLAVIILQASSKKYIIKSTADRDLNLPTICIREENLYYRGRRPPLAIQVPVLNNISKKLNIGGGGDNWILCRKSSPRILTSRMVMMGADVTHGRDKSVASLVASSDYFYNKFKGITYRQEADKNVEIILRFEEMVKELLIMFLENNEDNPPDGIVFYRDGVGRGQYKAVIEKEINELESAFEDLFDKKPKITFVLVIKRHHTRIFNIGNDNNVYNVNPGTVFPVDSENFFLCSHKGIQGTSKPSKYCLLRDDNKLSREEFIKATHALCHLYARCSRSISIPVMVHHAHRWALKGEDYAQTDDEEEQAKKNKP
ncbi:AGO1 [Cordylochernes scorpioides]|uniref:AGO1 n=1 Tax=Cordylochernes scorpioides TaxID=51811 RepID=A0ABY6LAR9_9ARAC|nr:AGO1 [Cordylochernes scorpioides]